VRSAQNPPKQQEFPMSQSSPILALPYLQPSQAQKHVTHNEALRRLDIIVQLGVAEFDATTPPGAPTEGEVFALGTGASGVWAGHDNELAAWLDGVWLFLAPQPGWRAWGQAEAQLRIWDGSTWGLPVAEHNNLDGLGIATTADAVNRLSVKADATLLSHDGAGHQLKLNKSSPADTASVLFQSNWTGHAEMGLAGDTNFAIKVSDDGSNWTEAVVFDGASGRITGTAVQSEATDSTPGRLMAVGAFGLGADALPPEISDIDDPGVVSGNYMYKATTTNSGSLPGILSGGWGILRVERGSGSAITQTVWRNSRESGRWWRVHNSSGWDNWANNYDQTNILGPVSQTGGTPTGAVIERGSNANGDYIRFADGTQMCTNANSPITTAPAAFTGTITKIDGDKLWIGTWF
jgi:hypothetical protein